MSTGVRSAKIGANCAKIGVSYANIDATTPAHARSGTISGKSDAIIVRSKMIAAASSKIVRKVVRKAVGETKR